MLDVYISRKACNSYIVYNNNGDGFIVDPGYNMNGVLIEHIKKLGVTIKAVLLTHGHYDHIDALEEVLNAFPDAEVYFDSKEFDVIGNPKLNLSKFRDDESNKILSVVPKNSVLLNDSDEFDLCGYHLKMISTPFHTQGSCCYLIPEELIMFTGDTLFYTTIGRTDLPTGSEKSVKNSLSKLLDIKENYKVYPGHGVSTSLEREKKYNTHLRNL